MTEPYPHLLSPVKLRHRELSSRVVFGPHTVNMSHEGLPGERHFGYYRERARGGAAMIVVEPVPAHRTGVLIRGNFLAESDAVIPHFRRYRLWKLCHTMDWAPMRDCRDAHGLFPRAYSFGANRKEHSAIGTPTGTSCHPNTRICPETISSIKAVKLSHSLVGGPCPSTYWYKGGSLSPSAMKYTNS